MILYTLADKIVFSILKNINYGFLEISTFSGEVLRFGNPNDKLKANLKEYLVDYGRTISSIKADQFILTTVNLRGRYKDIAERIYVQLKRSVLDQLDKGIISREKALEQVIITEY